MSIAHEDAHLALGLNGNADLAGHIVQFYERDDFLVDVVTRFVGAGLRDRRGAVVIATRHHLDLLERSLDTQGVAASQARATGAFVVLDAAEVLSRFLVDGWPDRSRFRDVVGGTIARAAAASHQARIRAFGEMVALLWAQGRGAAALRLEELWNELAKTQAFSLLCGYPIAAFRSADYSKPFQQIAAAHRLVIPAESYTVKADADARLRTIAELQQKAAVLESEVETRKLVEAQLAAKIEELAEVDRRKDEFLAMLGHELRNPLSPVTTALHLIRANEADPARISRARQIIERQVERMTRLIDDLLDVSRITRGRIELREESVSLRELIEGAVEIARPLIDERGHRLALELPEQPILLIADPARIEQVLANLLNNAAKYTDVGGHITLRARFDGAGTIISVKDDGDGIAPGLRDRIFDVFVQGADARRRARGGLGIGLTLARRIIELHGGTIQAFSDGPGKGSEFVIRLPMHSAIDRSAEARADGGAERSTPRTSVLIVDDNLDAAESLAELMRECGHFVRTAHDGPTALRDAAAFRPDVIVLDLGLPDLDGYEVARRLRADERLASTVVVALTGYGEERHRRRTEEAGFDHHLTKPVDIERLEAILASRPTDRARPN